MIKRFFNSKVTQGILSIIVIIAVIWNSIYNHIDRTRSNKYILKKIIEHKKDVNYFVEHTVVFVDKVDSLFAELDRRGLKKKK